MAYSIFVTNVVKYVVVADFEPILGKKIADIFEAVQTPKCPKKPVKQRKFGGSIEPPNWSDGSRKAGIPDRRQQK